MLPLFLKGGIPFFNGSCCILSRNCIYVFSIFLMNKFFQMKTNVTNITLKIVELPFDSL